MTGQEFLDAIASAGAEPFDLSEFDQCPRCGMIRGTHTVDCDADAIEALCAFGEAIATVARAALIRDAARGNSVEALHEPEVGTMRCTTATYWRDAGGWSVVTVERGAGLPITRNRLAIVGTPEDTAALVVDAALREFDRWSNEP